MAPSHTPQTSAWVAAGARRWIEWTAALVDPLGAVSGVTTRDNAADEFCEIAVMAALRDWRFRPLELQGHSVGFSVVVPFRSQLID